MKLPFIIKKRALVVGITVILLLLVVSFGVWVKSSKAAAPVVVAGIPFGGLITYVFYCNCSFNLAVTVGPPVGGIYMYQPGASLIYAYYQIFRSGPWVLGTYVPGGACMVYVAVGCSPALVPTGTIVTAGTSL
ncbi:MAG: hypothetical protein A2481_03840 [Candidatus Yonathbacteria bacterium RIFOXYC2_FULL_47_9]|nr:MAG: hypothetical protein A2481_03840 [Candidatus Yonathbacteria bacterium RIFOXYC2_FULL_47_9]HAT68243.1 hypothetical protein [Candidatus Yonathbacteria bacterium]